MKLSHESNAASRIVLQGLSALVLCGIGLAAFLHPECVTGALPDSSRIAAEKSPSVMKETVTVVSALGRLEPLGEVVRICPPGSQAQERLERVLVRDGQRVKAGDVIAVMDSRSRLSSSLAEALRRVDVAEAQLKKILAGARAGEIAAQDSVTARLKLELDGRLAEAEGKEARLKAEAEFARQECARYKNLFEQGAVSSSEFDSRKTALATAAARLVEAEAERRRLVETAGAAIRESNATKDKIAEVRPVDVEVARAEVASARAAAARIETELELSVVRAPRDGQILKVFGHAGETSREKGIADLGQTGSMVAVAEVYESDISSVEPGQSATVSGSAFKGELEGKVVELGHRVTRQNVYSTEPGGNFDNRVVEVKILLSPESGKKVCDLSNLSVEVKIRT